MDENDTVLRPPSISFVRAWKRLHNGTEIDALLRDSQACAMPAASLSISGQADAFASDDHVEAATIRERGKHQGDVSSKPQNRRYVFDLCSQHIQWAAWTWHVRHEEIDHALPVDDGSARGLSLRATRISH